MQMRLQTLEHQQRALTAITRVFMAWISILAG